LTSGSSDGFAGDLVQEHLHRLLELRVAAGDHLVRQVVDLDVRIDAVVLDDPFAVQAIDAELGEGDVAAVDERDVAADADQAAPGARADHRPQLVGLEVVWQRIAAAAGMGVGEHGQWPRNAVPGVRQSWP
jgi:hypothetical protein